MTLKKCETLIDIREEIDKVDEKIVELIAHRNDYIKQIAHFKNSIEEIKSPDRVEDIVSRVRTKAIALNLSPNLINDIFIRMIDGMIESEIAEFKNTKVF